MGLNEFVANWAASLTTSQRVVLGSLLVGIGVYFMIVLAFHLYNKYKDKVRVNLSDDEKVNKPKDEGY